MIQRDEFYTHSDDGDFEQKMRDLLLFHKVVKVEGGRSKRRANPR